MNKSYPIAITSESGIAKEDARIANLSMALGYKLEDKNRVLTNKKAYVQLGAQRFFVQGGAGIRQEVDAVILLD